MSISLDHTASNNFIYLNNFMDRASACSMNVWDNGTSKEEEKKAGNYWGDYDGVDGDGDGIGDSPYIIDDDYQDSYPLIAPRGPIPFFWNEVKYDCTFEGNATISICASAFDCEDKTMSFNINLANKNGFFNIAIPRTLLDGQFNVTIGGITVPSILCWNKAYTSICFEASIHQFDENSPYNVRIKADIVGARAPLKGDVNNDGIVDMFDAVLVALNFGKKS